MGGVLSIRQEAGAELHRLGEVWFPRSLDLKYGGFLCNFDRRWRAGSSQPKMLEFQARQTIAAARLAAYRPEEATLREAAAHGFRHLRETQWDAEHGGWYRMLDRSGDPREGGAKHGHGMAYGISACAACYLLTEDAACLELCKAAFEWLEDYAHDSQHGGYFVFYQRDGTPIVSEEGDGAMLLTRDPIGTPLGCKDANTTLDLMKALTDLYEVWPDDRVRERLVEILSIVRDHLLVAPGLLSMYALRDWTPVPDVVRYGQVLRGVTHTVLAAEALEGIAEPGVIRDARSMMDTMLRVAWDPDGGFDYAGSALGPIQLEGSDLRARRKVWWVQADGMRALATVARIDSAVSESYSDTLERLWRFVKNRLIDRKYGGWYGAGADSSPRTRRRPKASPWKDASHEVEALLDVTRSTSSSRARSPQK